MLLDDVISELDTLRRERLVDLLREGGGQSVITTTDLAHVPGGDGPDVARLVVAEGSVRDEVPRVRRGAPRPVGAALDGLTAALAPATLLAEVQRAWPAAAGEAFAAGLRAGRRARRRGHRGVHLGGLGAGARPALGAGSRAAHGRARPPRRHAPARTGPAGRPDDPRILCAFCSTFVTVDRHGSRGVVCYSYDTFEGRLARGAESLHGRGVTYVDGGTLGRREPRTTDRSRAATTPRTSPSSRVSRRSASDPACTSARPASAVCTTSSTRSSTTRSTRRWPATARASTSRSTRTTRSRSPTTAAASRSP